MAISLKHCDTQSPGRAYIDIYLICQRALIVFKEPEHDQGKRAWCDMMLIKNDPNLMVRTFIILVRW
jgi:hypothetical protein